MVWPSKPKPPKRENDPLSAEDKAIWRRVAKTVTPGKGRSLEELGQEELEQELEALRGQPVRRSASVIAGQKKRPISSIKRAEKTYRLSGQNSIKAVSPYKSAYMRSTNPRSDIAYQQDKKTRRGKVKVERKIDLHDLTQDRAFGVLKQGIVSASERGYKCILVVTGKGARLEGVLRARFPDWINHPDIRPLIASYSQAHIRHGGTGAWYVFLKTRHNI